MAEDPLTLAPSAAQTIEDYFEQIAAVVAQSPLVVAHDLSFDRREAHVGAIRGRLFLMDNSVLHIREYVSVDRGVRRLKYAYHYLSAADDLILRYDNTPHYPELPGFPHHKHIGATTAVESSSAPSLREVLDEIETLMG